MAPQGRSRQAAEAQAPSAFFPASDFSIHNRRGANGNNGWAEITICIGNALWAT
jgi:hypothetical protein